MLGCRQASNRVLYLAFETATFSLQVLPVLSEQLEDVQSGLLLAIGKCCSAPHWEALLKDLTGILDEVRAFLKDDSSLAMSPRLQMSSVSGSAA